MKIVSQRCIGYVAADLAHLCREAAKLALIKHKQPQVAMKHFLEATRLVQPSLQRGTDTFKETLLTWDDVGGLKLVRDKLKRLLEWPTLYQEKMKFLGLTYPKGILLYGPPGCSKTTIVKIIASETKFTFLSLNGAALYSPFVGESERIVRRTFNKARAASPSIIFIDEIDALVVNRSNQDASTSSGERVLSTLLNEMDGIENTSSVIVVAATNRPDLIDSALLRPGRLEKIGPPNVSARHEILQVLCRNKQLDAAVDLQELAQDSISQGYTGADLTAVLREASLTSIRQNLASISIQAFTIAFDIVKKSVSAEMIHQYAVFTKQYGGIQ